MRQYGGILLVIRNINYKIKIFIYLAILTFIIMGIAGPIEYINVVNSMESATIDANFNTIIQLKNSIEMQLQGFDSMLLPESLDYNLEHLAEQLDKMNFNDIQDTINSMVRVKSSSEYFRFCYVYYYEDKKVLDLNNLNPQIRDFKEIGNGGLLEEARKEYFQARDKSRPFFFSKIQIDKEDSALVLVKPLSLLSAHPRAIIVMSLKPSFFNDLMDKISLNPKANVYILDASGKVVMNNNQILYFNGENEKVKVDEKGYFKEEINGEQYLITFLNSKKLGWRYMYIIPIDEIYKKVKFVQLIIIIITVLSLSIGLVLSFIFAKTLYKPVLKLKSLFNHDPKETVSKDDIGYIDNNIKKLMTQNKTLEDSMNESMPVMKNLLLRSLLTNNFDNEEKLWRGISFHNANIKEDCFYGASVIRIDNHKVELAHYSERQIEMLQIYQRELIYNMFSADENVYIEVVNMDELFIALIVSLEFEEEGQALEKLNNLAEKIHSELSKDLKFTLTAGVGSIFRNLVDIYRSYNEAVSSYDYKVILGNSRIISIKEVPIKKGHSYKYPARIEKQLLNCLKQADEGMVRIALNDFFTDIRENVNDSSLIKHYIIHLFNNTFGWLSEMVVDVNALFPNEGDLHGSLLLLDTLDDAHRWFERVYGIVIEYINRKKDNKEALIVQKILEYIDDNYMCEDISLNILTNQMQYSIPYMERLFKDITGNPIKEYITKRRLEEAKRLLENPNLKIVEIGERVGYYNYRSFTSIFKKYQGESPSEYRDRYVKKL